MSRHSARRQLRAAQKNLSNIMLPASPVEVKATEGEQEGPPQFVANAYNGGPLPVKGYPYPVVLDLNGVSYANAVVANMDHDQAQRVGHVTEKENDGASLTLSGVVSAASDAAQQVATSAANGYPWQASIEAQPTKPVQMIGKGKTVEVNGQTITGPVLVAREAKLYGFAFLTRPADESTSVTIAASAAEENDMDAALREFIEAANFDPDSLDEEQVAFFTAQHQSKLDAEKGTRKSAKLTAVIEAAEEKRQREEEITRIAQEAIRQNPDCIKIIKAQAQLAIEGSMDVKDFQIEILRSSRPQAKPMFQRESDRLDSKVLQAALYRATGVKSEEVEAEFNEQTLEACDRHFRNGIGLRDVIFLAAEQHGHGKIYGTEPTTDILRYAFMSNKELQASGFSTVSLPGILSNVANKFLRDGFNSVESSWQAISAQRSVRDFKQITTYTLVGDYDFEKVGASGEIKHGVPGEVPYTNQADTYARMVGITRRDIINDDLGALSDVPRKLGRGAALNVNTVFWTKFLDNATFFTAGNNNVNTGPGSELDDTGSALNEAEVIFMKQTDPDGKPLGSMPAILLVPVDLRNTGLRLMNSQLVVGQGADASPSMNANVYQGRYTVVSSLYMTDANLTGNSTTAWYLLANPQDIPVIEVCSLNGQIVPQVETADADFNTLGVQMRGYNDFGVNLQEFRGGVRSAGA